MTQRRDIRLNNLENILESEGGNKIVVNDSDKGLEVIYEQYKALFGEARKDRTYEKDLELALLAPSIFLFGDTTFESTFDRIIYHLEQSWEKTDNDSQRQEISRVGEELFQLHTQSLEQKIEKKKIENNQRFHQKLLNFLAKIPEWAISRFNHPELIGLTLTELFVEYGRVVISRWKTEKEISFFYKQLSNIFLKILNSKIYNRDFSLVSNTFMRVKEDLIPFVISEDNVNVAIRLSDFDKTIEQKEITARLVIKHFEFQNKYSGDGLVYFLNKYRLSENLSITAPLIEKHDNYINRTSSLSFSLKLLFLGVSLLMGVATISVSVLLVSFQPMWLGIVKSVLLGSGASIIMFLSCIVLFWFMIFLQKYSFRSLLNKDI